MLGCLYKTDKVQLQTKAKLDIAGREHKRRAFARKRAGSQGDTDRAHMLANPPGKSHNINQPVSARRRRTGYFMYQHLLSNTSYTQRSEVKVLCTRVGGRWSGVVFVLVHVHVHVYVRVSSQPTVPARPRRPAERPERGRAQSSPTMTISTRNPNARACSTACPAYRQFCVLEN